MLWILGLSILVVATAYGMPWPIAAAVIVASLGIDVLLWRRRVRRLKAR